MRTDGNAAHAGDAGLAVGLFRICFVNGLNRAFFSADSAFDTVFGRFWNHAGASSFLIWTIAGNGWLVNIAGRDFFMDLSGKFF